jgi:hypothetical protein
MSGNGKAVRGFEVEDKFGPRAVSGGSKGRPLKPGVKVDNGPEKFRSWSKETGLTVEVGEGEIGVGETKGGGGVGPSWGIPRIVKGRRERGGRRANGPSPSCEGSGLLSLLKKLTPGKDDFDHYSLDGTGLRRSGLVSLPGQGRGVEQAEPEGGSLIGSIIAFFVNRED